MALPKLIQFDAKHRQLLVESIVQLARDAATLFFLRANQASAQTPKRFLGLSSLRNVRDSKDHSVGRSEATLSDSNERASKGFVSTLELKGKITIELKLDWILLSPPS